MSDQSDRSEQPFSAKKTNRCTNNQWISYLANWLAGAARRTRTSPMFSVGLLGIALWQVTMLTTQLARPVAFKAANQYNEIVPIPLQTELGGALCEAGVGTLITMFLYLATIYLVYLAIPDLIGAFTASRSKKGSAKQDKSEYMGDAGTKLFGAVIIGALPMILSTAGFSLLECVDAVPIF